MTKIDKTDLENIKLILKESKINSVAKIKIKKNDYEIEITSNDFNGNNFSGPKLEKNTEVKEVENTNEVLNEDNIVKSPMVGVAYLSADPNSQPYVKVGQHVKAGDTLLLIEAMKTFNEIKAPRSGIIKKIVTLNSQPVEYGDVLIIFE